MWSSHNFVEISVNNDKPCYLTGTWDLVVCPTTHRVNFEMAPTEFCSPYVSDIPEPGFPPRHSNIYDDPPSAGTL